MLIENAISVAYKGDTVESEHQYKADFTHFREADKMVRMGGIKDIRPKGSIRTPTNDDLWTFYFNRIYAPGRILTDPGSDAANEISTIIDFLEFHFGKYQGHPVDFLFFVKESLWRYSAWQYSHVLPKERIEMINGYILEWVDSKKVDDKKKDKPLKVISQFPDYLLLDNWGLRTKDDIIEFLRKQFTGQTGKGIAYLIMSLAYKERIKWDENKALYDSIRQYYSLDIGSNEGINKYLKKKLAQFPIQDRLFGKRIKEIDTFTL